MSEQTTETAAERIARYERAFKAIKDCELAPIDFGDYVQSLVIDVLNGEEPECWNCGTVAHEGPCVAEAD